MAKDYQNKINNFNSSSIQARGNFLMNNKPITNPKPENKNQDIPQEKPSAIPSSTRLNALDSTLLENEAYQDIEDNNFKSEYKINRLEEQIKVLDVDIENAKNINDFQRVDVLSLRKHSLQRELKSLRAEYGNSDITTKLSDDITKILNTKPKLFSNLVTNIKSVLSTKFLAKISKSFSSNQDVKQALAKLKTLNKNVDELINMQTPYGEADEWYDKLTDYLNSANVINYNISQTVGTPTFFDTISSIDKNKLSQGSKNSSNFGNMTGKKP